MRPWHCMVCPCGSAEGDLPQRVLDSVRTAYGALGSKDDDRFAGAPELVFELETTLPSWAQLLVEQRGIPDGEDVLDSIGDALDGYLTEASEASRRAFAAARNIHGPLSDFATSSLSCQMARAHGARSFGSRLSAEPLRPRRSGMGCRSLSCRSCRKCRRGQTSRARCVRTPGVQPPKVAGLCARAWAWRERLLHAPARG